MDANRIVKLRERMGLSQSGMAKALSCSKTIISHWETGVKNPSGITSRFLQLLSLLSDSELKKILILLEKLSKESPDA